MSVNENAIKTQFFHVFSFIFSLTSMHVRIRELENGGLEVQMIVQAYMSRFPKNPAL